MTESNTTFSFRHKTLSMYLCVNFLMSLLISSGYIFVTPGINNWKSFLYVYNALFSNTFLLIAVMYLILLPILFIRSNKTFYLLFFPLITLFQIFLITDIGIYKIFKFHINAMIVNFFVTPGSWDSVELGRSTIITISASLLFFVLCQGLLIRWLLTRAPAVGWVNQIYGWRRIMITFLAIMVVGDKLTFAAADILNSTEITRFSKLFPFYQPFTMKKFAENRLGITINRENKLAINLKSSMLNYPLKPIQMPPEGRKPNIIWIILDGYRYDMLSPEVTPHIHAFSKTAQVFANHHSGGNATRFGLFALFYGIYSYNWHQFFAERVSPVFIDTLIQAGYDFSINSSTALTYPEFRKTAFVKIPASINDMFEGKNAHEKDRAQITFVTNWLKQRQDAKPFFSFIFLDAAHNRVYPPEFEKFKTKSKTTNYLMVSDKNVREAKLNYMNALWYLDQLTDEVLKAVEQAGRLENTIILITGDHGDEFNEHGFFGHNSAFTPEQIQVPMVLYIPWLKGATHAQMTSHIDVPATMLDLLGVHAPSSDYSNGASMLTAPSRTNNLACSWSECSYLSQGTYINFSMETYNTGFFEVRNKDYQIIQPPRQQVQPNYNQVMQIIKEFSRFNQ